MEAYNVFLLEISYKSNVYYKHEIYCTLNEMRVSENIQHLRGRP